MSRQPDIRQANQYMGWNGPHDALRLFLKSFEDNQWGEFAAGSGSGGDGRNYPFGDGASAVNVTDGGTHDLITNAFSLTTETVASAGDLPNAAVMLDEGDHTGKVAIGAWSIDLSHLLPATKVYGAIVRYSGVTGGAYVTFSFEGDSNVILPGGYIDNTTGLPGHGDPWDGSAFTLGGGHGDGTSGEAYIYFDTPLTPASGTVRFVASLSGGPGTMTDPVGAVIDGLEYIPFPIVEAQYPATSGSGGGGLVAFAHNAVQLEADDPETIHGILESFAGYIPPADGDAVPLALTLGGLTYNSTTGQSQFTTARLWERNTTPYTDSEGGPYIVGGDVELCTTENLGGYLFTAVGDLDPQTGPSLYYVTVDALSGLAAPIVRQASLTIEQVRHLTHLMTSTGNPVYDALVGVIAANPPASGRETRFIEVNHVINYDGLPLVTDGSRNPMPPAGPGSNSLPIADYGAIFPDTGSDRNRTVLTYNVSDGNRGFWRWNGDGEAMTRPAQSDVVAIDTETNSNVTYGELAGTVVNVRSAHGTTPGAWFIMQAPDGWDNHAAYKVLDDDRARGSVVLMLADGDIPMDADLVQTYAHEGYRTISFQEHHARPTTIYVGEFSSSVIVNDFDGTRLAIVDRYHPAVTFYPGGSPRWNLTNQQHDLDDIRDIPGPISSQLQVAVEALGSGFTLDDFTFDKYPAAIDPSGLNLILPTDHTVAGRAAWPLNLGRSHPDLVQPYDGRVLVGAEVDVGPYSDSSLIWVIAAIEYTVAGSGVWQIASGAFIQPDDINYTPYTEYAAPLGLDPSLAIARLEYPSRRYTFLLDQPYVPTNVNNPNQYRLAIVAMKNPAIGDPLDDPATIRLMRLKPLYVNATQISAARLVAAQAGAPTLTPAGVFTLIDFRGLPDGVPTHTNGDGGSDIADVVDLSGDLGTQVAWVTNGEFRHRPEVSAADVYLQFTGSSDGGNFTRAAAEAAAGGGEFYLDLGHPHVDDATKPTNEDRARVGWFVGNGDADGYAFMVEVFDAAGGGVTASGANHVLRIYRVAGGTITDQLFESDTYHFTTSGHWTVRVTFDNVFEVYHLNVLVASFTDTAVPFEGWDTRVLILGQVPVDGAVPGFYIPVRWAGTAALGTNIGTLGCIDAARSDGGTPTLTPGTNVTIPAWDQIADNTNRVQIVPIQLSDTVSSNQELVQVAFSTPYPGNVGVSLTPLSYVESDTTSTLSGTTAVSVQADSTGYSIWSGSGGLPPLVGGSEVYAWLVTVTPA